MHTKSLHRALVFGAVLVLSACSSDEGARLKGERIDVSVARGDLIPDASVYNVRMQLPVQEDVADWEQVGANSSHVPAHARLSDKVRKAWSRSLGGGMDDTRLLLNPPVVGGGLLFAMNTKGDLYALDVEKGKKVWKQDIELGEEDLVEFSGGLAYSNGTLFLTTGTGEVFAINAKTGEEVWHANVGAPLRAAPAFNDDLLFVVSHNNRLFALKKEDGSLVWTHSGIEEDLAIMGGAPPAVIDGVVVVPYSSGEIYVLRAADGVYLWHDALSMNVGGDVLSGLVDVEASPVVANGIVYAVNHNGNLSAFDLRTGRRLWVQEVSATQMPWVAGNAIFVVTDDGQLVAIHRNDGRIRWVSNLKEHLPEKRRDDATYWAGPVLAGGRLVVVTEAGYALSLNPFNGEAQRLVRMPEGVSLAPIVAGGTLYFMTDDAEVIAFR